MPERPLGPLAVDLELDRLKRINLAEYVASRGYRLVRREPTRSGGSRGSTTSSLLMRHPTSDDKIVLRLDHDGHWTYFSVRDDSDNGTIIDFVQRRGARTIAEVREELRGWSGEHRAVSLSNHVHSRVTPVRPDSAAVREIFARAKAATNDAYLNGRGIRPEILACERIRGTWRVNERGELLFPHRDGAGPDGICGFERKSARFAGFSAGGRKTIWASNVRGDDAKLVFTEAVIDAFSYHQLQPDPRARYASTGGSFGQRQARHVAAAIAAMPLGSTVVIATDNDHAGEILADKILALAGDARVERHRAPIGKDWNEYLQRHERDYIRALGLRGQGRAR